jgi:peptide/nickel transport system permease protein
MPGFARVTRAEVITLRGSAYVEAARHFGWSRWQVTARHILPNALSPVIALATISLGAMMVASSSLSFLGLGPQPPTADWGAMLSDSHDYLALAWWPAVFPGAAITIAILAITLVGHRLRDRTDRRQA